MPEIQRYLSVRSRATKALMSRLRTITFDNGYSTEFNTVWINNSQVERADNPPEIYLLFGRSVITDKSNTQYWEDADVEIWFIVPSLTEDKNEEYDLAVYDILSAINPCNEAIYEGTESYEVWIDAREHQPHYQTGQERLIWGRIRCGMKYFYLRDDHTRWDITDTPVLKED